ncbi:YbeD family protein [Lentisalinibacter sediminis]|uniref:YbeD family protein n=1 Tax=Lentisalinibacter sediminis TaxID=2992237 RepID=UPI003870DC7D
MHEDSLLEFPCDFPIKVMGRDEDDDFRSEAVAIVEAEVGPLPAGAVTTQPSRNGRFLSVTVTVRAESRAQLDSLYRRLSNHERVLVVL